MESSLFFAPQMDQQQKPMKHSLGTLLRYTHFAGAVVLSFLTVFGSTCLTPWMVLFWVIMLTSNLALGGCPITTWERAWTNEDVTVVDPLLQLALIPVNKTNRNLLTLLFGGSMLTISLWRLMSGL